MYMYIHYLDLSIIYVLMRDEKEERSKQGQINAAHPRHVCICTYNYIKCIHYTFITNTENVTIECIYTLSAGGALVADLE